MRQGDSTRPCCLEAADPVSWPTPEPEFLVGSCGVSNIRVEAGCAYGLGRPLGGTRGGQQRRRGRAEGCSGAPSGGLPGGEQLVPSGKAGSQKHIWSCLPATHTLLPLVSKSVLARLPSADAKQRMSGGGHSFMGPK